MQWRVIWVLPAWMLAAMVVIIGCAGSQRLIAESGGSLVRLERDPTAMGTGNAQPAQLSPERLRTLLATITVQSPIGAFSGRHEKMTLFDPEDLEFIASAVSEGLVRAQPTDRVVFYLRQRGRLLRPEVTTGAIAMKGESLALTLGHYRRADVEGVVQDDRNADNRRQLRADPMFGVYDRDTRIFAPGATSGDQPRTILFAQAGAPSPASANAVREEPSLESAALQSNRRIPSDADTIELLRRQITELTKTQRELQNASSAREAELESLRQALAETKQALADKVLEINRLKSKSKRK